MSENYTPRPDTQSVPPYNTVVLSQRDLGLRVPINFVTDPGVSLKAACFNENRYEDDSAGDCISDLLAVGFRRFELDLYWNDVRKVWSFCPVAIPPVIANLTPFSTVTPFPYPITNSNFSQFPSPATISSPTPQSSSSTSPNLNARQMTASTLASPSPTSMDEPSLGQSLPSTSSVLDLSNNPLVAIGPYVCTTTINLSTFTSLLLDYIQKTETTLQAHLLYLILNIHAASSELDPGGPAPLPTILPQGSSELLGELFAENLTNYIYSEFNLLSDRGNLNDSWYNIREEAYSPVNGYYDTTRTPNGVLTTEDGWPSEGYIEFANSKRLLVGYGNIDPQMSDYNFTGDAGTIFREGFIQDLQRDVTATADGVITSGCFMNNDTIELAQRNSSWAVLSSLPSFGNPTAASADLTPLLNLTSSATNCGISPHLNTTLLGTSASTNSSPYSAFSQSTIWSWAPNEPQNASTTSDSPSPDSRIFRCAISNKDRDGRWVVDNCSAKRFAACQASSQPYNWTITDEETVYSFAAAYCPEAYTFAAPRTALENAYLTLAMQRSGRNWNGHGAWVDFNSLDIEGCWVTGGQKYVPPLFISSILHLYSTSKYMPVLALITSFYRLVKNSEVHEQCSVIHSVLFR
ncbi:related to Lectin C-type domain protein [Rhynchosporium agropyri]|uniref:Maintenance of telomere capping protein 6 n=1 Tax=Rhynchosporium agropyri TaxID=914238 RepID=A0A1E1LCT9_9HELO|nr:related to Lectin C-type domain protein [Rhynchosporium agropyri]